MNDKLIYSIPARFRRIENLHIVFWLVKDACWAMNLSWPAILMIVPTMGAALLITWQTRKIFSELMHNLAILFWITANCTWMIGEFFGWDEGPFGLRRLALIPFGIGLLILLVYYLLFYTHRRFRERVVQQAERVLQEELQPAATNKSA